MPTYYSISSSLPFPSNEVKEGAPGQLTPLTFVVWRSSRTGTGSVRYRISTRTNISADDITGPTSGTVTFEPGENQRLITIYAVGDGLIEPDEAVRLELFDADSWPIAYPGSAFYRILNDDGKSTLTITPDRTTVSESTKGVPGSVTFTLQRSSSIGGASIDYAVQFNTALPADFASPTQGTVVFAPGETTRQLTLTLKDDSVAEDPEQFYVGWFNGVNLNDMQYGSSSFLIADNESIQGLTRFTLTSAVTRLTEGDQGVTPWTVTVTRSDTAGFVSVDYDLDYLSGGPAFDWAGPTWGTVLFAPGEKSRNITLNLVGDTRIEEDTLAVLRLTRTSRGFVTRSSSIVLHIDDNDLPIISIRATSDQTGEERLLGPGVAHFLCTRNSPVGRSSATYRIVPGTASAADFGLTTLTGTVTFEPGQTELDLVVPFRIDAQIEPTETFSVQLTDPTNARLGTAVAQGAIADEDSGTSLLSVELAQGIEYENEPWSMSLTITRTLRGIQEPASMHWQVVHDTTSDADFVAGTTQGVVEFAANQASKEITIQIAPDRIPEGNERFLLALTDPVNARIGTHTTAFTIRESRSLTPPGEVNITAMTPSRPEGDQVSRPYSFLVTSPNGDYVDWQIRHGTTDRNDFVETAGSLSFRPGETAKILQILVAGDTAREGDETFEVVLTDAYAAAIGPQSSAAGIIVDDDLPEIGITVNPTSAAVLEGGPAGNASTGFLITRSSGIGASSVTWTLEPGSGVDALDVPGPWQGTISFADGETTRRLIIPLAGDNVVEADERLTVRLSRPVGATLALNTTSAEATIVNDDLPTLRIAAPTANALPEGASGTTAFIFTISRDSGIGASSATWTVKPGTAQAADFSTPLTGTVTFAPGETSKPVTVLVRGDTTIESDETFTVELSAPKNALLGQATASATIVNDDWPTLSVKTATDSMTKAEGGAGVTTPFTFNVTRSDKIGTSTVAWSVLNQVGTDSADFAGPTSGQLTFLPGQMNQAITVQVQGDALLEATEVFAVQLANPVGATLSPTGTTAQATILNDDWPVLSIDAPTGGALPEGQSGTTAFTFTVTRDLGVGTSSATWTVQPGTAQTADFGTPLTGTVSFASGETRKTISVPVKGDTTIETDETFSVVLSAPKGAVLGQASAQATIVNDDLPLISVRTDAASVSKPEGSTGTTAPFTFTATRSSGVGTSTVDWTVRHITGNTTADDFAGTTSGTLTFAPGVTSLPVTVQVQGDAVVEGDESFDLALTNARNASFGGFSEVRTGATIRNDDLDPPTLAITRDNAVRNEGAPGTTTPFTFKVTRSHGSGTSSVDWAVNPFGADAADFSGATSGTLRFAAGQTEQLITVQVAGDSTIEADELFLVQLRNPVDATITTFSTEGTIVNDDLPLLSIAADTAEQDEGSSRDGPTEFRFTVTRQPAVNYTEVNYRVVHGTTNADDFLTSSTTGTVTFADGQSSKPVSIRVMADLVVEANERFSVELHDPMNGTLLTRTATMTILGDDAGPLEPTLYAA